MCVDTDTCARLRYGCFGALYEYSCNLYLLDRVWGVHVVEDIELLVVLFFILVDTFIVVFGSIYFVAH